MITRVFTAAVVVSCALIMQAVGDETTARESLKRALEASAAKDARATYRAIRETIGDPGFTSLEPEARHSALELAYLLAYQAKDYREAHVYSERATTLPGQSIKDWAYRLHSAADIKDVPDEARSVAGMLKFSGPATEGVTTESVNLVFGDTKGPEYTEARKEMLLALYDHQWRPADGASASQMWLALSLTLLESNDAAKAAQVVTLVDDPTSVIAIHADRRYEPLLKARHFESDAKEAERSRIKALRENWTVHPRSLGALVLLTSQLLEAREDKEALALATQADLKIVDAFAGSPPFDDIEDKYSWLLEQKSRALEHFGDFEGALSELRRSSSVPHPWDSVSHAVNLAEMLCSMGRPEEAVGVLPAIEKGSGYGKMQIVFVGLMIAVERRDEASARALMDFLEAHQAASPKAYQDALLIHGDYEKAKAVLVSRLSNPDRRTDALVELQTYAERKRPPKDKEWHAQFETLKSDPEVQRAVEQVGAIGRYTWRYD